MSDHRQPNQTSLQTTFRDIRASAAGLKLALSTQHQRLAEHGEHARQAAELWHGLPVYGSATAGAFAQAIAERYGLMAVSWSGLDMVLRAPEDAAAHPESPASNHFYLAPNLSLTLVQRLLAGRERVEVSAASSRSVPSPRDWLRRPGPDAHAGAAPPQALAPMPVRRVLRRAAAADPPARKQADSKPSPPRSTSQPLQPMPAQQAVPAPVDVIRLTDQVIRAIDQRIIAQRERLGRH